MLLVLLALCALAGAEWRCPSLSARPAVECSCDLPHTMRCAGDHTALQLIGRHLREQKARVKSSSVSLLDISLRGVSALPAAAVAELAGAGVHGLVISSGDVRRVQQGAFVSVAATVMALGLPNNQLPSVPTEGLQQLTKLERLDLSNNKIHVLDANSFKGIENISYLDLSDNQLTDIAADAFKPLMKLIVLRLRGNLLKVPALPPLKGAVSLRELDLSSNALEGPLSAGTVPALARLTSLHLADNTFASIRRGALSGLPNLTQLNLHNNQIDVLEDYAFRHLTNLTQLDLSHNEIVAVSGASLAQLTSLRRLDLSHNFLRSLSAEPLRALRRLGELMLHDNDISMVDDGALGEHTDLSRFTVEDNPLNCDCLMAGFARWLREAKNLTQSDKSAAVCATPPHLEGALLSRLSKNKLCDDFEHPDTKVDKSTIESDFSNNAVLSDNNVLATDSSKIDRLRDSNGETDGLDDDIYDEELDVPSEDDLPISKAKVNLEDAWFDSDIVHLSWTLEPPSGHRLRCTGVTVAAGDAEPKHVACHRADPGSVVLRGLTIDPGQMYTFCVAFEEMDSRDLPLSLLLGCGPATRVRERAAFVPVAPTSPPINRDSHLRVSEVRSNLTSEGVLTVLISVMGFQRQILQLTQRISSPDGIYLPNYPNCYVVLAVLSGQNLVAQKDTPCQANLEITMEGFLNGPYEVCATLTKQKSINPICVVPQLLGTVNSLEMKVGFKNLNSALLGMSLGLMVLVVSLGWFIRKMLKKPAVFEPHRCFRSEPVMDEAPRASYVMLTATSKV